MTTHILFLLLIGIAMLGMFYLPRLLNNRLLSLPIVFVGFGMIVFSLPLDLPIINPDDHSLDRGLMEYLSEFIVIISLAATGIKIDLKPTWKNWNIAIYLLGIAMPLCIASVAWLGWAWLGLAPATALLLGAVLAPTDPVLASQVQVGPPNEGREDSVRFGLTLEAGLNDGLAFPFVYLALAILGADVIASALTTWLWWDFAYRIAVGVIIGYLLGRFLPPLFFKAIDQMERERDTDFREGIFVVAATLIVYSVTEIAEGYGFLAVFVAAVVSRNNRRDDAIHERTYQSIDQVEQALLGVFLIGFGGMLATGILDALTWPAALLGIILVLVIRPLSGLIAFSGCKIGLPQKLAISFFGIRGIGSIYYLAYAHNHAEFPGIDGVWSMVSFTILFSIVLHGVTVLPILNWVDRWVQDNPDDSAQPDA